MGIRCGRSMLDTAYASPAVASSLTGVQPAAGEQAGERPAGAVRYS